MHRQFSMSLLLIRRLFNNETFSSLLAFKRTASPTTYDFIQQISVIPIWRRRGFLIFFNASLTLESQTVTRSGTLRINAQLCTRTCNAISCCTYSFGLSMRIFNVSKKKEKNVSERVYARNVIMNGIRNQHVPIFHSR